MLPTDILHQYQQGYFCRMGRGGAISEAALPTVRSNPHSEKLVGNAHPTFLKMVHSGQDIYF
jgi:hypothetical protein